MTYEWRREIIWTWHKRSIARRSLLVDEFALPSCHAGMMVIVFVFTRCPLLLSEEFGWWPCVYWQLNLDCNQNSFAQCTLLHTYISGVAVGNSRVNYVCPRALARISWATTLNFGYLLLMPRALLRLSG